ncbi:MAG: c-type cytochrome domain-containing protein [Planctomycetota bacterium]
MENFADILAVFGRMHPMVLHLPIGLLMGLGVMEFLAARKRGGPAARGWYLLAAITAFIAAASGWRLHEEDGFASSITMERHEWVGIGTMAVAIAACVFRYRGKVNQARWALALACLLLLPTGHLGAEMTHGKGFLFEPLQEEVAGDHSITDPFTTDTSDGPLMANYEEHIAPLLAARCTKCHGSRKVKGELRLDTPEHILAGGEGGAILASPAEDAEIYRRLRLPLEHDDHMPPESKTQLLDAEIDLLRLWVEAGAPFEQGFALGEEAHLPDAPTQDKDQGKDQDQIEDPSSQDLASAQNPTDDPAYQAALATLHTALVHVQPIEPGSPELWIDFAAIADQAEDDLVLALLSPLHAHIAELSLSRSAITDASLEWIATLPALTHLDLASTSITDAGLGHLAQHPSLQQLNLSRTQVSAESTPLLQELPSLTHLWLWESGFTPEQIASLRTAIPNVLLVAGDSFENTPLEVEPDLVFTSDAPLIDAPPASAETNFLQPQNTLCPVSNKPVDPRYSIIHEGNVIGFCCPNCPKTFWDNQLR